MKKLTNIEVDEIKGLLNTRTYKIKDIASTFNVCRSNVSHIGNNPRCMFKKEKHLQIWDMYQNLLTITDISKIYNVSRNIIYAIKHDKYISPPERKPKKKLIQLYVKDCVYCNNQFIAKCKNTRFCSSKCGSLSNSNIFRYNMIKNNPMFRKDVKSKVSNALKEGYNTGRIKKKLGIDNPNWRGTRTFSNYCRLRLYHSWIFPIMKRDKFKCTKCGSNKQLQVHHINELRNIIKFILSENNISNIEDLSGSYKYDELIEQVVNIHTLSDGITVCHDCHKLIDERYRRINYETQESKKKRL